MVSLTRGPSQGAGPATGAADRCPLSRIVRGVRRSPGSAALQGPSFPCIPNLRMTACVRRPVTWFADNQALGQDRANMESPRQVNVSRSRTPPTAMRLIDWSACEHLSPQRGIWCSNQLNTNSAHGIPSELSLTTARGVNSAGSLVRRHLARVCRHARGYARASRGRGVADWRLVPKAMSWLWTSRGLTPQALPVSLRVEPSSRKQHSRGPSCSPGWPSK
jgi:hypothetical protein